MSHVIVTEEGRAVSVQVRPYVKKSRTPQEIHTLKEEELEPAKELLEKQETSKVLLLKTNKSTLIRNHPSALEEAKKRREIKKQQNIQSVRQKLGKSKQFKTRDPMVMQHLQEPHFISHR